MDSPESSPTMSHSTTRSRTHGERSRKHKSPKERERSHFEGTSRELVKLLVHEEKEGRELRNLVHTLSERLKDETARADNAEQRAKDVVVRFKELNEARLAAMTDAARTSEELSLYKLQLENAQREIARAQELLDAVEAQRREAEESAARARTTARKLKEEKLVQMARDEGRLEGIKEGIERGRLLGYEEGRAEGYARGRAAAARDAGQKGQGSPDSAYTLPFAVRQVPLPPPSSSNDSPRVANMQPPVEASAHHQPPVPTSATPPIPPPQTPVSVHNAFPTPRHSVADYMPDNYIPVLDEDNRIRLPPPHEMGPGPFTPSSSPPHPAHQSMPEASPEGTPILVIPPPLERHYAASDSTSLETPTTDRRPRPVRRRKSNDSSSTTFSQFDLIGPPVSSSARSNVIGNRHNALSAIVEEKTPSMVPSTYIPGASPSIPVPVTMPTPQAPTPISLDRPQMQVDDYYTRPGSRSSPESASRNSPQQSQSRQTLSPKGSMLSNAGFNISVEPPSRPESGRSGIAFTEHGLLSANDAEHAPLPSVSSPQVPHNPAPSPQPIILQGGQLPAGFVPMGVPLPSPSAGPVAPGQPAGPPAVPPTAPAAPPPTAPPIYRLYSPAAGTAPAPHQSTEPVVIPLPPSGTRPRRYSRSAVRQDSSSGSDEDATSSSSSMDSLTTPPERHKNLPGPSYAAAPMPPGVVYPTPAPRSVTSQPSSSRGPPPPASSPNASSVAPRVLLPQSSVGSPRSIYTRPGGSAVGSTVRPNRSPSPVMVPPRG